jgi:hypothetical protein
MTIGYIYELTGKNKFSENFYPHRYPQTDLVVAGQFKGG